MVATPDPLELSRALIRCPSVTPTDAGALDVLRAELASLGFTCHDLTFSAAGTPDVRNLYARIGTGSPNFCFAGHTDVVPVGDAEAWSVDPFAAEVKGDWLIGRGASDMKCAVAAMVSATARFLKDAGTDFGGSISFLITGDEEGPAVNGTVKVLDWMRNKGETIDACLVGEPTSADTFGDTMKIGRRGSMNAWITAIGVQGHSAYPDKARNPIPELVRLLAAIDSTELDSGTDHFPPSHVALTNLDVGNAATNVIPAEAQARLNIRFNDQHTGDGLTEWLTGMCEQYLNHYELDVAVSGEAFLTQPGPLSDLVQSAVRSVIGQAPELSTTGGTSDARFIKDACPVCEFGMLNTTAHKVDEKVLVSEIYRLTDIYSAVLAGQFGR